MIRWLAVGLVLGLGSMAWAGPVEDLKTCQEQSAALVQEVRAARTAYTAKLAEMLAEERERGDLARAQLQELRRELERLKAPPKQ